jgi:hypothetical protein
MAALWDYDVYPNLEVAYAYVIVSNYSSSNVFLAGDTFNPPF